MVVVDPLVSAVRLFQYNRRCCFSSASTRREFLKLKNKSVQEKNLQSAGMKDIPLETDRTRNQRPLYAKHPMSKFTWTTAEEDDTAEWSTMCLGYLNNIENFYNGKDNAEIIYSKAVQTMLEPFYKVLLIDGSRYNVRLIKELYGNQIRKLYHTLSYNMIEFTVNDFDCRETISLRYADLVLTLPSRIRVLAWPVHPSKKISPTDASGTGSILAQSTPSRLPFAEDLLRTLFAGSIRGDSAEPTGDTPRNFPTPEG